MSDNRKFHGRSNLNLGAILGGIFGPSEEEIAGAKRAQQKELIDYQAKVAGDKASAADLIERGRIQFQEDLKKKAAIEAEAEAERKRGEQIVINTEEGRGDLDPDLGNVSRDWDYKFGKNNRGLGFNQVKQIDQGALQNRLKEGEIFSGTIDREAEAARKAQELKIIQDEINAKNFPLEQLHKILGSMQKNTFDAQEQLWKEEDRGLRIPVPGISYDRKNPNNISVITPGNEFGGTPYITSLVPSSDGDPDARIIPNKANSVVTEPVKPQTASKTGVVKSALQGSIETNTKPLSEDEEVIKKLIEESNKGLVNSKLKLDTIKKLEAEKKNLEELRKYFKR